MTNIRTLYTGFCRLKTSCFVLKRSADVLAIRSKHFAETAEIPSRVVGKVDDGFHSPIVQELIDKYINKDEIPWQEIKSAVAGSSNPPNGKVSASILRTCIFLKWVDVGLSYFKYANNAGENFTLSEYALLLKLLTKNPEKIVENEEVAMKLFDCFKPYIEFQELLHLDSGIVFSCFKNTWKELVNICSRTNFMGQNFVVAGAFNFDEPDIGWKLWHGNPNSFENEAVEAYFNYCIRRAKEQKFSVSLINDIVSFCDKYVKVLPNVKLVEQLNTLTAILNGNPSEKYNWSVKKAFINDSSCCLNCGYMLSSVQITNEEFEQLKSHILKDVFINQNINIKTSGKELKRFLSFLRTCPPYDTVLDGLNVLFKNRRVSLSKTIAYLREKNKKVLLIGKEHLKNSKSYKNYVKYCQMFLVDNRSDDDIFFIYAAINGGIGTCFISSDYLRGYSQFIQCPEIKRIFLKWQKSHQHFITTTFKIKEPQPHSHLPQKTELPKSVKKDGQHCWHLSSQSDPNMGFIPQQNFYWERKKLEET